jgi:hypothetical protein
MCYEVTGASRDTLNWNKGFDEASLSLYQQFEFGTTRVHGPPKCYVIILRPSNGETVTAKNIINSFYLKYYYTDNSIQACHVTDLEWS